MARQGSIWLPPLRQLWRLLRVLRRHDALEIFAPLVPESGLGAWAFGVLHGRKRAKAAGAPERRPGQRLAAALTELGPSYIKAGQLLATRVDLIGEQGVLDLTALQDRLPGFDFALVRAEIERQFEAPLETLFASFDEEPLSAASVAQVHFAVTSTGQPVAVKVLRPGIRRAFAKDLALFRWLAALTTLLPGTRSLNAPGLLTVYERQLQTETDLRLEAAAMETFFAYNEQENRVVVPRAHWDLTARTVLTMTRVEGVSMNDRDGLIAAGHDLEHVFGQAAELLFLSIFRDGYFHGDQHGGNLSITAAGQVALVDYGIMGSVAWPLRVFLADVLMALLQRDYRAIAKRFLDEGYLQRADDLDFFALSLRAVCEPIIGQPLDKVSFGRLVGQLLGMGRAFNFVVQPELFILQKNMIMAEGIARRVAPGVNIWTLAQPLIESWMRENRGPQARVREEVKRGLESLQRLPDLADRLEVYLEANTHAALGKAASGKNNRSAKEKGRGPLWPLFWATIGGLITLSLVFVVALSS